MNIIPTPAEVLAIIPARGGSKGLPGKNLKPLAGHPLITYTIAHALAAQSITRLVVSTDSDAIAAVSRDAGAEVIRRPDALSTDTASTETALHHVLDTLAARDAYTPDLVVLLQCTSPLRLPGDIDCAVAHLRDSRADSLLSVAPFGHFLWHTSPDGSINPLHYNYRQRPRRQDYAAGLFVENGSIYVFPPAILREHDNRLGGKIVHYTMHPITAIEIDTPYDFAVCEALMAMVWPEILAAHNASGTDQPSMTG